MSEAKTNCGGKLRSMGRKGYIGVADIFLDGEVCVQWVKYSVLQKSLFCRWGD